MQYLRKQNGNVKDCVEVGFSFWRQRSWKTVRFSEQIDNVRGQISEFSKFSAPTIAFLAFWLAKKLRLYEPIVRVLRHMENSALSLKIFAL